MSIAQFKLSLKSKQETLNAVFIHNYLSGHDKKCLIVLFRGSSDKEILHKLNIVQYSMLNIQCYDTMYAAFLFKTSQFTYPEHYMRNIIRVP